MNTLKTAIIEVNLTLTQLSNMPSTIEITTFNDKIVLLFYD